MVQNTIYQQCRDEAPHYWILFSHVKMRLVSSINILDRVFGYDLFDNGKSQLALNYSKWATETPE